MLDHLSIGVRDLAAARSFYDALFAPLGASVASAKEKELAYGPGGRSGHFFLYAVAGAQIAGLGAHAAFRAPSRMAVDQAYAAALAQGASTVRAAGPHPDIDADYYGAILLDPDGNKIEIIAGTMH